MISTSEAAEIKVIERRINWHVPRRAYLKLVGSSGERVDVVVESEVWEVRATRWYNDRRSVPRVAEAHSSRRRSFIFAVRGR